MTRKLNLRVFALLVTITTVLAVVIHMTHIRQVHRSIAAYLRRVDEAEAKGDSTAAARYLQIYLSFRPNDFEAMGRYALLLCKDETTATRKDFEDAARLIEVILIRSGENSDLRRRLARLDMTLGRLAEARDHFLRLIDAFPRDSELHLLLAETQEHLGDFRRAAAEYDRAISEDPTNIPAYSRLARVLRLHLKEVERADKLMDIQGDPKEGIITKNPQSSIAWLQRSWYRREFSIPGALEDVEKAVSLDPDNLPARLLAAELAASAKPTPNFKAARDHIDHVIAKHSNDRRVHTTAAEVEIRARDIDAATARLEVGLKALPKDLVIRWSLIDLKIQAGRLDGVPDMIATLRAGRFQRELLDYLDAQFLYASGKWAEAARALERVGQTMNTVPEFSKLAKRTFIRLGECYERLGNTDLRLDAYQRAVGITPLGGFDQLAVVARNGLAASLIAQGRIDRAIEEYRKNLLLPEATEEMRIVLARLLIFRNLRLPEGSRRWEEIESLLNAAAKVSLNTSSVAILRAETFAAQRQLDRAQELLTKARDAHPEQIELWVALSVLALRQERSDDALQILTEAEKRLGDKVELRLARGRYWSIRGGPDAVASLQTLSQNAEKFSSDDRFQLYNGIADAMVRLSEIKQAITLWEALSREQPNNLLTRMHLFDAMSNVGTDSDIQAAIDAIKKIEGNDGSLWRYCQARLLIRRSPEPNSAEMSQAAQLLNEITIRRPAWPRAPLSLAEIDDKQEHTEAALKNYQRALSLGERDPQAIRRTVQLFYRIRRYDQADQVLRQFQEEMPISTEMQRLAANVSLQTHDYSRALDLARRAVSKDSSDYADHIWLGQLLWAISRRDEADGRQSESSARRAEAETSLRRATELGRTKSEAWVALVQFLSGTTNIAAAESAIAEAEKAIPANERDLPLAVANETIGRTQLAEILFKKAVAAHPDDPSAVQGLANFYVKLNRIEDAKPLLERLIDLKAPDAPWARRILAIALSLEGREQLAFKALGILDLDQDQGSSVADTGTEDLRVKARFYALQRTRDRRREAIRLLETVNSREGALVGDRLLLARLYEDDGNWSKARDQYNAALGEASDTEKQIVIVPLIRGLLVRKYADDAQPLITRLRELAPGAPALVELESRVAVLVGKPDRAVALIREYVKDKDSQLMICAGLFEELALYPAAEELYRRLAALPGQPDNVLVLAEYLGRRGRGKDALDLCEAAWKTLPPTKVAVSCMRILYGASIDQDACNRVANHIDQAIKADPKAISLVFDLANVRVLQGRYDDAEKIFLDVYNRNQANVNPLNNLAWVLVMQDSKSPRALEMIDRAITVRGAIPEFLDTRGVIHLAMGRTDLAVKELEDSVAVSPNRDSYFHLAQAYVAAKRVRDAADALQEARNLGLKPDMIHPLERPAYEQLVTSIPKT